LPTVINPSSLEEEERRLLLHLFAFPVLIDDLIQTYEIHKLTHFAIELARHWHSFYAAHPVLKAEDKNKAHRLALTGLTFSVLKRVLGLIGVSQPERMVSD
jgi:arginyl-tRNA synthetase